MICYVIIICTSFIIRESNVAPVEEVFSWICMVMLVAIGANSDPIILGIIIKMYINYIITSVVVIDLTNELIMKSRLNIGESTGGIACIMKDMNVPGAADVTQLMPVERTPLIKWKDNRLTALTDSARAAFICIDRNYRLIRRDHLYYHGKCASAENGFKLVLRI